MLAKQHTGGTNATLVRQLELELTELHMEGKESIDLYLSRCDELKCALADNLCPVLPHVLWDRIVNGLPAPFNEVKSGLRMMASMGKTSELRALIHKEAVNLGWKPGQMSPTVMGAKVEVPGGERGRGRGTGFGPRLC